MSNDYIGLRKSYSEMADDSGKKSPRRTFVGQVGHVMVRRDWSTEPDMMVVQGVNEGSNGRHILFTLSGPEALALGTLLLEAGKTS